MRSLRFFPLLAVLVPAAFAQAPVEDARLNPQALQQEQQKAGMAYRELQQAGYEAKQAELEYRQADADYKGAQKRADEFKRHADAAKKNLDAAKAREEQARKSYAAAINAVDQSSRRPVPK